MAAAAAANETFYTLWIFCNIKTSRNIVKVHTVKGGVSVLMVPLTVYCAISNYIQ